MEFLYQTFDNPFARKVLKEESVPNYISGNIKYTIRPYQDEAFKRYICLDKADFEGKPKKLIANDTVYSFFWYRLN